MQADRQAEIIHECGEQCMDEDTTGSEAFQRRWWGRHQPLEPDPRNIVTSTVTAVEETATGSSLRRLSLADLDPNGGRGCVPYCLPACPFTCLALTSMLSMRKQVHFCSIY